jgi:hypothetical protein
LLLLRVVLGVCAMRWVGTLYSNSDVFMRLFFCILV